MNIPCYCSVNMKCAKQFHNGFNSFLSCCHYWQIMLNGFPAFYGRIKVWFAQLLYSSVYCHSLPCHPPQSCYKLAMLAMHGGFWWRTHPLAYDNTFCYVRTLVLDLNPGGPFSVRRVGGSWMWIDIWARESCRVTVCTPGVVALAEVGRGIMPHHCVYPRCSCSSWSGQGVHVKSCT